MRIALIASDNGEKALYLHDFFKEGNRICVDCLLTDNPESPIARRMHDEGIDVVFMAPGSNAEELASLLKGRDVELLVVDDFSGELPEALKEAFGEAIVFPSVKEQGPLEVIQTSSRLKAAAAEAARPKPRPDGADSPDAENAADDDGGESPSVEREWAEVLEIDVEDSPKESDVNQPPVSPQTPPPPYGQPQSPYGQPSYGHQQPPYAPYNRPHLSEPMPDNYLVWSVLLTIFCCLIPGIIAVVYSASVSSRYYAGDLEGAKRASRNAQIWCIVSVVAGVIWASLYLPLALFMTGS